MKRSNFTATPFPINQNLNYEKIYVFLIANMNLLFYFSKFFGRKILI